MTEFGYNNGEMGDETARNQAINDIIFQLQGLEAEQKDSAEVYLALCEDNTDICLSVYLLLRANEVVFTESVHVYIYICHAL